MGLLDRFNQGMTRFSQRANGLLFPGLGVAEDPELARRAQAQAMMQMGMGLLGGGRNYGAMYGAAQQAGYEPIEQARREAAMRAAAANQQAEADYRNSQVERQTRLDQQNIVDRNRDRMYRRFDKQDEIDWRNKEFDANQEYRKAQLSQRNQYAPAFNDVVLANGNVGAFDQRTGRITDTGVKAKPTGSTAPGSGLNERQTSGVNMQRDAAISYAANLTGMSRDDVARVYAQEGPDGVAQLIKEKGKRALQGAPARVVQSIPGGKMLVEATNSELIAPVKAGGAGIAMYQNPTGPITTPDFQAGEAQMPQPIYPLETQAEMVRQLLMRGEQPGGATPDPLGLRGY